MFYVETSLRFQNFALVISFASFMTAFVFDITILLQIKVNGNDLHTFEHRMPVERVCAMQIAGDVSIQTINVIGVRAPCLKLPA